MSLKHALSVRDQAQRKCAAAASAVDRARALADRAAQVAAELAGEDCAATDAYAERLADAIAAGHAAPAFIADAADGQRLHAAQREAAATTQALQRLSAALEGAEAELRAAQAAVALAADEILDAQARALLAEIKSHEDAIAGLASNLSAFVVENWRNGDEPLSCNFEITALFDRLTAAHEATENNINVPVNQLRNPVRRAPAMDRESRLAEMRLALLEAAPGADIEQPRAA